MLHQILHLQIPLLPLLLQHLRINCRKVCLLTLAKYRSAVLPAREEPFSLRRDLLSCKLQISCTPGKDVAAKIQVEIAEIICTSTSTRCQRHLESKPLS